MRAESKQAGWLLAAVNVLTLGAFLASRPPEYERLRDQDRELASGFVSLSTAEPMHLAGRPFYSSAHVKVPWAENLYFLFNTPAMLAAIPISFTLSTSTYTWRAGSSMGSSAWESWALALVFGALSAAWAFAVGVYLESLRHSRQKAA